MQWIWRLVSVLTGFSLLCLAVPVSAEAAACFDSAPAGITLQRLFTAAPLPPLTAGEANELHDTMVAMRGRWSGTASGYWCFGTADTPSTKPDDYTVDATIGGESSNQLKLTATLRSEQDSATHRETLALFLRRSQFYVDTPAQPDNTHMQARSFAPGRIFFAQMAYPANSGRVFARAIDVQGESLTLSLKVYTHDVLTAASTWHLTRRP